MNHPLKSGESIKWTPELVGKFWAGVSRSRLSEISSSRSCGGRLLELVEPYLNTHSRYLDYGAGDGDLVAAMLCKGYHMAAHEPNQTRLEKLDLSVLEHPKFLGVVGDNHQEPFDGIFMVEVIEHILDGDMGMVFQRVRSMLRRGGLLIVTTPLYEDLELNAAFCPSCEMLFHRWQHVRAFAQDALIELLAREGFRCEWQQAVDFSMNRFMVEELNAMNAEIDRLHAQIAQSFCERVKRFFGGMTEHRTRYPNVSLKEFPSNIVYVGRLV
ncbi:MAG: class I SAM-dependent methyltransferase [Nitrospira sp.]|nr:class I SAM-dependent methyltransferase [Nitrospira sp.]